MVKLLLNKIFPSLAQATALAFTTILLVTEAPLIVQAHQLPSSDIQRIIPGLNYPTSSERFFDEGRHIFKKEVQLLRDRKLFFPENILQISDKLLIQIQEDLTFLEDPNFLLIETDK